MYRVFKFVLCALTMTLGFSSLAAEYRDLSKVREGLLTSAEEVAQLPTSGPEWDSLLSYAQYSTSSPNISDQDDNTDVYVLAKALVYARTGNETYRNEAYDAIMRAIGTHQGGRLLAVGRNLVGYVMAADLIQLSSSDDQIFRDYIRGLLTETGMQGWGGFDTLETLASGGANNWGCHARGSVTAVARYLGDQTLLDRMATRLHDWMGRTSQGFKFGETSWQCDESNPVGINPKGCVKSGRNLDGVVPDDQRRAGSFDPSAPFPKENYAYECLQGTMAAALQLHRAGYTGVFEWQDQALYRAFRWLNVEADFPAQNDDGWQPHIINHFYGSNFEAVAGTQPGKNMGYTDWLLTLAPEDPISDPDGSDPSPDPDPTSQLELVSATFYSSTGNLVLGIRGAAPGAELLVSDIDGYTKGFGFAPEDMTITVTYKEQFYTASRSCVFTLTDGVKNLTFEVTGSSTYGCGERTDSTSDPSPDPEPEPESNLQVVSTKFYSSSGNLYVDITGAASGAELTVSDIDGNTKSLGVAPEDMSVTQTYKVNFYTSGSCIYSVSDGVKSVSFEVKGSGKFGCAPRK